MGNWLSNHRTIASGLVAASAGALAWSGHAATLPASIGFLFVFLMQPSRWKAYSVALAYYAGSTWPLAPGANTFFGPNSHLWQGVTLWLTATVLLATPWGLAHFGTWPARFWSIPLALAVTCVPPLGLIGWASPLTAAGMLFPGTAWLGIIATVFLPTVIVHRRRLGLCLVGSLIALAHAIYPGDLAPPTGWEAVDTTFGRSELESPNPVLEFQNAEWIEQRALNSHARFILFPEMAAPRWNDATEAFWEPTLAALASQERTIAFGTTLPIPMSQRRVNSVIIRGANAPASFFQRIPPPISMWKPLSQSGFPLRLAGPATVGIANQRVGILICYELLITWPVLSSIFEHPTILVGMANDYWASQTPIPAVQRAALTAWARLFALPRLMAVNT